MRSDAKKVFYYHADASSLGGFIEEPFEGVIPAVSSISLPAVGGYATNRTEALNFKEIISCRSAYTRSIRPRDCRGWSVVHAGHVCG